MRTPCFLIVMLCFASITLAEDFKTIKGKEYKNARVSRVEPDGIVLVHKFGVTKVYFSELPKEVQKRFGYDTDKIEAEQAAARAAEEKRIEEQRAAEEKRSEEERTAERERAEREKNADAEFKRSLEEFQAAEQRAAQTYQHATKGTLSGQVFVSTEGGENFKLGAVKVSLFGREAIDILIAAPKEYAGIKIQQLRPASDKAKIVDEQAQAAERAAFNVHLRSHYMDRDYAALEQAYNQAREAASRAEEEYESIEVKLKSYYSGAFYFAPLLNPVQTAETDADGRFVIEVPQTGGFVIAAQAERRTSNTIERYYWLQPVSLEGQQQHVQNLSNSNLTSTTGTSALIRTQD